MQCLPFAWKRTALLVALLSLLCWFLCHILFSTLSLLILFDFDDHYPCTCLLTIFQSEVFFLSGYKFFNIFPITKYGLGFFPFILTGFGDRFYQQSIYNRSEVLWFLRWGHKRLHNFCLVLLERPSLCMIPLEILSLQILLFGIQPPMLWKSSKPLGEIRCKYSGWLSLPVAPAQVPDTWVKKLPDDSRLQWSKLPSTIHQSQARVPDIMEQRQAIVTVSCLNSWPTES